MVHLSYIGGQNIALEQQSSLYLKIYYFYYAISISYFANIIMMLKFIYEEGKYVKNKKTWVRANLEANEDNGSQFLVSIKMINHYN